MSIVGNDPKGSIPVTTAGRLRTLLRSKPEPIILIGAGASVTSGVPAAGTAVELMVKFKWCLENDRSIDDPTVTRASYWPWLLKQHWFDQDKNLADLYPSAVKHLLNVSEDRRQFFRALINPSVDPREGYLSLAEILHQRWVTTVLTTNFDECLQKAKNMVGRPHQITSIKTASDLVMFSSSPRDPQLIYLHGSIDHYTDKNLDEEVRTLDPLIVDRIRPMLMDHPIIVVGYRGNEQSVMDNLFLSQISSAHSFPHGIYWCTRSADGADALAPKVKELASGLGGNFTTVPIQGFDQLFSKELWGHLREEGVRPAVPTSYSSTLVPLNDMSPCNGATLDDLDMVFMFTRLKAYSEFLKQWTPDSYEEGWTLETAEAFNLIRSTPDGGEPTLAGVLLFGKSAERHVPSATIDFVASGPREWLIDCFGDDVDFTSDGEDTATMTSSVSGSLWAQLDALLDVLSKVNSEFRLKEETSRQVRSYSPLAIKEMVVNSLAHRDYSNSETVKVSVTPNRIVATSPGGLVPEVATKLGEQSIDSFIKNGGRNLKGYRNPVIADLFYGGGAMDHTGSGLSDLWRETVANNGSASFDTIADNGAFQVVIEARPEAIDQITRTAVPASSEVVRFASNLLPFSHLPEMVWHAGCTQSAAWRVIESAEQADIPCPPGHVFDGRFYTLYDLASLSDTNLTPFDPGDIEAISLDELVADEGGRNVFVKLLNDFVVGHIRNIGLYYDHRHKRAYYTRTDDEEERKITYRARLKKATRTVVRPRRKSEDQSILWYEHKALEFSLMEFGADWALALTSGYAFTRNGYGQFINREKTNVLSTKRAAKDFNANAHNDATFWMSMIAEGNSELFALRPSGGASVEDFAPTISMHARLPTASYQENAFAYGEDDVDEFDDFQELAEELDQLSSLIDDELAEQTELAEGNADDD